MRFFAATAALVAVAAAHSSVVESVCSGEPVTVTVTSTLQHTPSAPGASPYYPTTVVGSVSVPVGTGYPETPLPSTVGTGSPAPPAGTGYPSGTGAYPAPSVPAEFTGAANAMNAAGFVAGVGAFAALFL